MPIAEDDTLDAYFFEHRKRFLIAARRGLDITKYPYAHTYLSQYKKVLEQRYAVQNEGIAWYEIVRFNRDLFEGEQEQIYCYYRSARSKFAYTNKPYCTLTTTFVIRPKQNCVLSSLYILALLNSHYLEEIYFRQFGKGMGKVVEYSSTRLEQVPIRRINFTTPPDERSRLLEKARTLYATCIAKDDPACVLDFVEHHLTRQPEQTDVVHDLLAFLAEEMIRLNKEKRATTRDFLDWLTSTLSILPDKDNRSGIDALTGKSKLLDFPGDYQKHESALSFDQLLDILQKNRTRLGVRLTDTALTDKIRLRYEESSGRVLPLKEQLAKTDRLIDRVVYRLYGLTEEEIKVVEGKD